MSPHGKLLAETDIEVREELRTLEVFSALHVDRAALEEGSYLRLTPCRLPAVPYDVRRLNLMSHVCYSSAQGLQDIAHSNPGLAYIFRSFGYRTGGSKKPGQRVIFRTNKWGPYGRTARLEPCIYAIYLGIGDARAPLEATARLFLDDGRELFIKRRLASVMLGPGVPIFGHVLSVAAWAARYADRLAMPRAAFATVRGPSARGHTWTIHPTAFGLDATEPFHGVLCLECDYANISAYWALKTRTGRGVGIDHLSGS